jgi:hypothetical protein
MNDPTAAQVRAWAAENGYPEVAGGRGQLPADVWRAFRAAESESNGSGPSDGYVSADEPPDAPADDLGPSSDVPEGPAEERPGRPGRARFTFRRPAGRRSTKAARPRRGRTVFKRVSIAPLIEDAYEDMAMAAGAIPPLARCLRAQAPLAGVLLDPVVKDTIADRAAQPLARNYEKLKVINGLLGTPMALMAVMSTAPALIGQQDVVDESGAIVGQVPVYAEPSLEHKAAMVALRYSVRAMADAAGSSMKHVAERAEQRAEREDLVDEFIAYLLGVQLPDGQSERAGAQAAGMKLAGAAS